MPKLSECLKPHALTHTLTGLGLGLLAAALFPSIYAWGATLGVIFIVVALAAEFIWNK